MSKKYSKEHIEFKLRKMRSDFKKSAYETVIKSDFLKQKRNETRDETFNRLWRKAMKISRKVFGNNTLNERQENSMNLVIEDTFSKKSILSSFRKMPNMSYEESYKKAEHNVYFERTNEFRKKYGNVELNKNLLTGKDEDKNETIALEEIFEMFFNGELEKSQMNEIIDYVKTQPDYYTKSAGSD